MPRSSSTIHKIQIHIDIFAFNVAIKSEGLWVPLQHLHIENMRWMNAFANAFSAISHWYLTTVLTLSVSGLNERHYFSRCIHLTTMAWKRFPDYLTFVRGIHRWLRDSLHNLMRASISFLIFLTYWGWDETDNISQTTFSDVFSSMTMFEFVPKGSIDNSPALAPIMAWRRICDKPLSEPMLTWFTDAYLRHLGEMS